MSVFHIKKRERAVFARPPISQRVPQTVEISDPAVMRISGQLPTAYQEYPQAKYPLLDNSILKVAGFQKFNIVLNYR